MSFPHPGRRSHICTTPAGVTGRKDVTVVAAVFALLVQAFGMLSGSQAPAPNTTPASPTHMSPCNFYGGLTG